MNAMNPLRAHTGCWVAITLLTLLMRIAGIHAHLERSGDADTLSQSVHWYDPSPPALSAPAAVVPRDGTDTGVCIMTDALTGEPDHMAAIAALPPVVALAWIIAPPAPHGLLQRSAVSPDPLPPPRPCWHRPPLRGPPR